MKRRLSVLVVLLGLLAWAQPAHAAIAQVSKCGDPSGSPGPTCGGSGISTTGATLLVAVNGTNASSCPTDSQTNTWTSVVNVTGGPFSGTYTICYVNNPSTSGSHTFTCAGTLCGVVVVAYSGTDTSGPLDGTKFCSNNNSNPSRCAAALTPTNNGSLIFAGMGGPVSAAGTLSIDSSLTIQEQVQGTGGVSYGADCADLVQITAAAIQPGWNDSAFDTGVVLVAVFKPGAGGGGCVIAAPTLGLMGVGNCKGDE